MLLNKFYFVLISKKPPLALSIYFCTQSQLLRAMSLSHLLFPCGSPRITLHLGYCIDESLFSKTDYTHTITPSFPFFTPTFQCFVFQMSHWAVCYFVQSWKPFVHSWRILRQLIPGQWADECASNAVWLPLCLIPSMATSELLAVLPERKATGSTSDLKWTQWTQ